MAEVVEELFLCEHAKTVQYVRLGFVCALDGSACFNADRPGLVRSCPTRKKQGAGSLNKVSGFVRVAV